MYFDDEKERMLLKSVSEGNLQKVQVAVEQGANIDYRKSKQTPLLTAIQYCFEEIAIFLIDRGADVDLKGNEYPLVAAVENSLDKVTKKLLEKGVDTDFRFDKEADSVMTLAAKLENLSVLKMLHSAGGHINDKDNRGFSCLHIASEKGHFEMVKYLVEQGLKINARTNDGETALHWAAYKGFNDIVHYLMDKGANPAIKSYDGESVLMAATRHCSYDAFKRILDCGWNKDDRNDRGKIPLFDVIQAGDLEKTKALIEAGADIEMTTGQATGYVYGVALHEAIAVKALDIVEYLLENGISIEQQGKHHQTPLILALDKGFFEIATSLINHGAAFNVEVELNDELSNTRPILNCFVLRENIDAVRFLIRHGTDLNRVDSKGNTALYSAAENGYKDIVELLLNAGADCSITNLKGYSPSGIAMIKGHDDIEEMIESFIEHQILSKSIESNEKFQELSF